MPDSNLQQLKQIVERTDDKTLIERGLMLCLIDNINKQLWCAINELSMCCGTSANKVEIQYHLHQMLLSPSVSMLDHDSERLRDIRESININDNKLQTMKNVIEPITNAQGDIVAYAAYCPGCNIAHVIYVKGSDSWNFNENLRSPTFVPSLMVNYDLSNSNAPRCHSFIRNGQWHFLNDCTHSLRGKTIPMEEIKK